MYCHAPSLCYRFSNITKHFGNISKTVLRIDFSNILDDWLAGRQNWLSVCVVNLNFVHNQWFLIWLNIYILKEPLTIPYQWHFIDDVFCCVQTHAQLGLTFICEEVSRQTQAIHYWDWCFLLGSVYTCLHQFIVSFFWQSNVFSYIFLFQAKRTHTMRYPRQQYKMCTDNESKILK